MFYSIKELRFLEENKNKNFLIFAYGRLKYGYVANCMFLDNSETQFLGEKSTKNLYTLYDLKEYPILSDLGDGEGSVRGELYSVNAETILKLDKYLPMYEKKELELDDGTLAYTYLMTIRLNGKKIKLDIDNLLTWKG